SGLPPQLVPLALTAADGPDALRSSESNNQAALKDVAPAFGLMIFTRHRDNSRDCNPRREGCRGTRALACGFHYLSTSRRAPLKAVRRRLLTSNVQRLCQDLCFWTIQVVHVRGPLRWSIDFTVLMPLRVDGPSSWSR